MVKIFIVLFFLASTVYAGDCTNQIKLTPVPASNRQGVIIYKSNWNVKENREQTVEEGNHSQKGLALLINYKQKKKKYLPNLKSIEVRSLDCRIIGYLGRYPRCTVQGCGDWERWYSRTPGGSRLSPVEFISKADSPTVLIRLKGRQFALIQNLLSEREIKR